MKLMKPRRYLDSIRTERRFRCFRLWLEGFFQCNQCYRHLGLTIFQLTD